VEHDIAERSGLRESEVHRFRRARHRLISLAHQPEEHVALYGTGDPRACRHGNVLIRGWGACYLLRSVPHIVSVRICAPMRFRTRVLMKRMGIAGPASARREIERNDAAHNGTMQRMFGVDWMDASLYAITLNTSRVPPEDCVAHIARMCESETFRETEYSRAELMDQLIMARVTSMLSEHFGASYNVIGIDAQVKNSKVTLSGAISDEHVIADIVRRVRAVDGVSGVESKIQYLAFTRPSRATTRRAGQLRAAPWRFHADIRRSCQLQRPGIKNVKQTIEREAFKQMAAKTGAP
jgi:cytidylate kinase